MVILFWASAVFVVYPYVVYPLLLILITRLGRMPPHQADPTTEPSVSIILPVHNEAARIATKLANIRALEYPDAKIQVVVVTDGCTDDSLERAVCSIAPGDVALALANRSGKAACLNAGVARATGDIIVFTDAAILLEAQSLRRLVAHFSDPEVGCVSGEDYVSGSQSEGVYGRLELMLRREEARLHSIAGASGCFYAQRRELCVPFKAGMAPDFLSVLEVVKRGYRAIAEPSARGTMTATDSAGAEFSRKVRTFLRGITTLFGNIALLNPIRHPRFSFILVSHKLMRWLAPFALLGCLVAAVRLRQQGLYGVLLGLQLAAYLAAAVGLVWPRAAARAVAMRLGAFFLLVNAAALVALYRWATGTRVEIWEPTRRS